MKSKNKVSHICIVRPNISIFDHADALASQAAKLGISCCFIDFESMFSRTMIYGRIFKWHTIVRRSSYLFLSTPYPEHYPKWLIQGNYKLAYAGYGLTLSNWVDGHFSSGMIRKCAILLAGSESEYLGYSGVCEDSQATILTGNPLMWEIRNSTSKNQVTKKQVEQILWAPHWTATWFESSVGFSRWRESIGPILSFAETNPKVRILVRPHPILLEAISASQKVENSYYKREILASLRAGDSSYLDLFQKLLTLRNVKLSCDPLPSDILNSDALLTEGVSIIGYWASTGKPMAVYRDENSPDFGANGRLLLEQVTKVANPSEILDWLKVITGVEGYELNEKLVEVAQRVFPTFDHNPIQIALDQ